MGQEIDFINHLYALKAADRRKDLAELRRGLGKPAGAVMEMHRNVVPFLTGVRAEHRWLYYGIASLFASHPASTKYGNMGSHVRKLMSEGRSAESVERRFTILLKSESGELHQIGSMISLLRSASIAVNWEKLILDLRNWNAPSKIVQHEWARSFWADRRPEVEVKAQDEVAL